MCALAVVVVHQEKDWALLLSSERAGIEYAVLPTVIAMEGSIPFALAGPTPSEGYVPLITSRMPDTVVARLLDDVIDSQVQKLSDIGYDVFGPFNTQPGRSTGAIRASAIQRTAIFEGLWRSRLTGEAVSRALQHLSTAISAGNHFPPHRTVPSDFISALEDARPWSPTYEGRRLPLTEEDHAKIRQYQSRLDIETANERKAILQGLGLRRATRGQSKEK